MNIFLTNRITGILGQAKQNRGYRHGRTGQRIAHCTEGNSCLTNRITGILGQANQNRGYRHGRTGLRIAPIGQKETVV